MSRDDVIQPFRWDVSRREQLGTLPEVPPVPYPYRGFVDDLVECSARVLAFAGDSDIIFLGRTPECIFDLTSGVLAWTSWQDRLGLLNLSLRWSAAPDVHQERAIRPFLAELGLHPRSVERRPRPVVFVDYVSSGYTFGAFLELLRSWCDDEGAPWRPIAERIKIIGLTMRTQTSPKTRRWQQHVHWVPLLRPASITNVSLPGDLGPYLAGSHPKATVTFPPERWADHTVRRPRRDEEARRGLEFARHLYLLGCGAKTRNHFARVLAQQPAAKETWLRSLALEIRPGPRLRARRP